MGRKTIFITGASSGIGRATAELAAGRDWNVALFARRGDRLADLARDLGDAALALEGDVTRPDDLERAIAATVDRFGGVDAAFANAGRGAGSGGRDGWRAMVDVNVMGLLYTAEAVLPELKKTKGTLVLTGSAAGRMHIKGSVYGATKWFVHGYAGNMAEDMRDWGGRCCVIAPGMVDTEFFDQGKPDKLHPEDVAAAVLHAIEAPERAAVREIFLMPQH